MVHISFNPADLPEPLKTEWEALMIKARRATDEVIEAWEKWRSLGSPGNFVYKLEEDVWGSLKKWLVRNVFHDKCAYCETRLVRDVYHADHYRPKGRVRIRAEGQKKLQTCITRDEDDMEFEHPGYFWLAYHWLNLLPCCNYCNTALGKKDQFPVERNHLAVKRLRPEEIEKLQQKQIKSPRRDDVFFLQPEDLDLVEGPLLLNPYLDSPSEHIVFGDCGEITHRKGSKKGLPSILVYDLQAEKLRVARQTVQETALKDYLTELARGKNLRKEERIKAAKEMILHNYIEGGSAYSAAVLDYLRLYFPDHNL
jgi:hypothetical protein